MKHATLNKICEKIGVKASCQAGPAASFRFAQKQAMPDEFIQPDATDLRTMVVVSQLYNETVSNKIVYTLALHNKIKKAETNSLNLPQNMCEGVDAEFLLNNQRERGLILLALANQMRTSVSNALATAIPKLDVQPSEIQPIVDGIVQQYTKVHEMMLSLPNIFSSV